MLLKRVVALFSALIVCIASTPMTVNADSFDAEKGAHEANFEDYDLEQYEEVSDGNVGQTDTDTEFFENEEQDGQEQKGNEQIEQSANDQDDSKSISEMASGEENQDAEMPEEATISDDNPDDITTTELAPLDIQISDSMDVSSAEELETAISSKISNIHIVSDFELDRTFYVTSEVNITSSAPHVLTRANNFAGDIFVVGENANGEKTYSADDKAILSIGESGEDNANLLVIDGNSDNMQEEVTGTVLFICNGAEANIYNSLTFTNNCKVNNSRTLDTKYHLPYPEKIGGSVAIIANGVLNVYGGSFNNNRVLAEGLEDGADRTSSMGAVFYNYSNLNIYGGEFCQNSSGRGGVIYNYRMLHLFGGHFDSNYASKYGGVIYQAESQFGELLIGEKEEYTSLFENNSALNSGGVIYSQTKNAVIIYGNTSFKANKAISYNGGAINISGTLTVKDEILFEGNSANSKGGAVYIVNDDPSLTTRIGTFHNVKFKNNKANRGGAIGIMAAEATQKEGGIANFESCTFEGNEAVKVTDDTTDMNGGAIYINRKSKVSIKDTAFVDNKCQDEGGAIYCSGESEITINNSSFDDNSALLAESGNGGAVALHSSVATVDGTSFNNNHAGKNAGAFYISYVGDSEVDSTVTLNNSGFYNNEANYGGALYMTSHVESDYDVLTMAESEFGENHALYNGGAMYSTSSKSYLTMVNFSGNVSDATANESGSRYGGGALYLTKSSMEINGAEFINNTSDYNGGALAIYSNSHFAGNNIIAEENLANYNGGAVYVNKSSMNLYHSNIKLNAAKKNGGGIAFYTEAVSNIYTTAFTANTADNGGGICVYTGDTETMIRDCEFKSNVASAFGGACYCANESRLTLFNNKAVKNRADNGGVAYITKTGTEVNVAALTVSENVGISGGSIIYGNTNKATLNIDKDQYTDLTTDVLDDTYWASAIVNKLTVNEVSFIIPEYEDYSHEIIPGIVPQEKDSESVKAIFDLENGTEEEYISDAYNKLEILGDSSNFCSRNTTVFENINGKNVTVDTLVSHSGEKAYNPNVAEGILIYEAMKYKREYPEKEVFISLSTFHFSVEAAVCINRNSRYFGYMRQLPGKNYDKNGFVRIAYLLVTAAKMGIHVNAMGQIEASLRTSGETGFVQYFENYFYDKCDKNYVRGGLVKDYLLFNKVKWTSYGDDAATDMMHTKVCAVSNYIDKDGKEHSGSLWLSSINLDGINSTGTNNNNNIQSGCVVSDHDRLYQAAYNYLKLVSEYCGQEDIYEFRNIVWEKMTEQIDLINAGKDNEIPPSEKIVYLGSSRDDVFELYFSPFGGDSASWNEKYNPFCKYLSLMSRSDDYVLLIWNNPKFKTNYTLGSSFQDLIVKAFHTHKNANNRLYLVLPGFDSSKMNDLKVGTDIGYKSIGTRAKGSVHNKDLQISYSQNGKREYVSLLNSMNLHQGSMSYQSNHLLIIKENNCNEDSVFYTLADQTSVGVVEREDKNRTISFETNGGSEVESITAEYDSVISEPEKPVKEGNTFEGWYLEPELLNEYTFEKMPMDSMVLYAKWTPDVYRIEFDSNGGSHIRTRLVTYGAEIGELDIPSREGYTFGGWFMDEEFYYPYDYINMPSEDIYLYAKWNLKNSKTSNKAYEEDNTPNVDSNSEKAQVTCTDEGHSIGEIVNTDDNDVFCQITKLDAQGTPTEGTYIHSPMSKKKSVRVPSLVILKDGCQVKITGVANSAFENNKRVRKVVLSNNIRTIGDRAFYNCQNLKKLVINTSKLKNKSIGKKALGKISEKAYVFIPAKCRIRYPKIFRKRGLSRNATIYYPKWTAGKK